MSRKEKKKKEKKRLPISIYRIRLPYLILILNLISSIRKSTTSQLARIFIGELRRGIYRHKGTAYLRTQIGPYFTAILFHILLNTMRRGRVVQLWFLVIHRPRNTRLRLHDLSFFTRDTRTKRTLVSKTWWIVHRLPSPNDLPAPRRERGPTWPLLNATLDLSRVYLPTYLPTYRVSIFTLTSTPFSPDFAARWKGKKREKEREEDGRKTCMRSGSRLFR